MNHPHDNDDRTIPSPVSDEDLSEKGINVDKPGFYNPDRGAKKVKTPRPEPIYGPLLATDPGQPDNIEAKGITRDKNSAVERGERATAGVDSGNKPTARKATSARGQRQDDRS
jgi:hypothetical protein